MQVGDINDRGETVVELVADRIPVTAEGKARARALLADADRRRDPDRRERLRAQLGLAPA